MAGLLGLPASRAVARDIEQVEAVGAAAIPARTPSRKSPRDRAVRDALKGAVQKSASSMLVIADETEVVRLHRALGNDPYLFVSRFRVVEDRGVQPALFNIDEEIQSEYRVIVEVHLDRDLIRDRLVEKGLLEIPSGDSPTVKTRIALEGLDGYQDYEAIRTALVEGVGARSAVPIEALPGLVVIAVDSGESGYELLTALERAIPAHLELIPVQVDTELLRLRVAVREPGTFVPVGDEAPGSNAEIDRIDTTERNRY